MARPILAAILVLLTGCATTATSTAESQDRAECKEYARKFEHSGRMKDACLISRGYTAIYSTNGGDVLVRSKVEPRQTVEVVANDLKGCNDASWIGYVGRLEFAKCMDPRGYAVRSGD